MTIEFVVEGTVADVTGADVTLENNTATTAIDQVVWRMADTAAPTGEWLTRKRGHYVEWGEEFPPKQQKLKPEGPKRIPYNDGMI